ncbi:hypothetical protein Q3C01_14385 [Bradyrhizobium sp. UFLA05-109]
MSYFQESHPEIIFRECSHYCELVSGANQIPPILEAAIREAVGNRGGSVVVIPGDVALRPAADKMRPKLAGLRPPLPVTSPKVAELDVLADTLNRAQRVTVLL